MRCPPRDNAMMDAIFLVPVALVVQPRAYVPHKSPLTNRIRRHFARIKAAAMHRYQLWLLRKWKLEDVERRTVDVQEDARDISEVSLGIRKRRDRRPGRSCRPPCHFQPQHGYANGVPFPPRSPARRCDRLS